MLATTVQWSLGLPMGMDDNLSTVLSAVILDAGKVYDAMARAGIMLFTFIQAEAQWENRILMAE